MNDTVTQPLLMLLRPRLELFGISDSELDSGFDMVKSGLLNSLEFVELVTGLEKRFGIEVDFEAALDKGDFTTVGGLVRTIQTHLHG